MKGGLTGFIEAIICYPTEFVKTQLQLQSKANPATWIWMGGMNWIGMVEASQAYQDIYRYIKCLLTSRKSILEFGE